MSTQVVVPAYRIAPSTGDQIGPSYQEVDATHPFPVSGTGTGGEVTVEGTGTAGTPAGGVLSIQGVDGGTPIAVDVGGTTSIVVSQQVKIAATGTAVELASSGALENGITITASSANAATIFVGPSTVNNTGGGTGNGYPLAPGASLSLAVSNANIVWVNGTVGDWVGVIGN